MPPTDLVVGSDDDCLSALEQVQSDLQDAEESVSERLYEAANNLIDKAVEDLASIAQYLEAKAKT